MGSDRSSCSSERGGGQVLKGGRAKGAIREWCGVSAAATQMGKKYEMTLWSLLLLLLSSFFVSFFFREQRLCSTAAAASSSSALLIPQTIFLVYDLQRPA